MNIQEVSEILGVCYFLRVPRHIFMTSEKVWAEENGVTFFRGLQPKSKQDSIFLSASADNSTPIHEAIHTYGVGEAGTEVMTRAIMRKNKILENFPVLKGILGKKVRYEKVESDVEYPWAHQSKWSGRVEHFVLVEG